MHAHTLAPFLAFAASAAATGPAFAQSGDADPALLDPALPVATTAPALPPAPTGAPRRRAPQTAQLLSLAGAVLPLGLVAVGVAHEDESSGTLIGLGAIGNIVGPLAGHWYAGKAVTKGLAYRLAGVVGGFVGAMGVLTCEVEGCSSDVGPVLMIGGTVLLIGGAVAYLGGLYSDIATADDRARAFNAAHAPTTPRVAIAPSFAPDGRGDMTAGIALAGSY